MAALSNNKRRIVVMAGACSAEGAVSGVSFQAVAVAQDYGWGTHDAPCCLRRRVALDAARLDSLPWPACLSCSVCRSCVM